jgi:hypothetical protein
MAAPTEGQVLSDIKTWLPLLVDTASKCRTLPLIEKICRIQVPGDRTESTRTPDLGRVAGNRVWQHIKLAGNRPVGIEVGREAHQRRDAVVGAGTRCSRKNGVIALGQGGPPRGRVARWDGCRQRKGGSSRWGPLTAG